MTGFIKDVIVAVKGFFMGAANVVPGVSGGTIALVSGIYEELISSLNSIMSPAPWKALLKGRFNEFWQGVHGRFLLWLFIGVIISVFSIAKIMEHELMYHPIQVWALFFGLIIASAFFMLRDIKGWKWIDVLVAAGGIALGLTVCTLSPTSTPDTLWFVFICGAIAICTMILPGISGSFILVILGKYDFIMSAVSDMNIPVLVTFAVGCGVGILAFAKFLHWLLSRAERQTMLVLVGFVIGSLVKVWPWNDMASVSEAQILRTGNAVSQIDMQIPSAILWCVIGIAVITAVELLGPKKKSSED